MGRGSLFQFYINFNKQKINLMMESQTVQQRYQVDSEQNIEENRSVNNPEKVSHNSRGDKVHVSMVMNPQKQLPQKHLYEMKTKTEMRTQLPELSKPSNFRESLVKNSKEHKACLTINKNKNIAYMFREYCKQSYIGGVHTTFDQIAGSGDKMTLNKWMVFLKQFQLVKDHSKALQGSHTRHNLLSKVQAANCFKEATDYKTHMQLDQFLNAIYLVKTKLNLDEQYLVSSVLHADTHLSARNRMSCLRITFSGPHKNFFVEGAFSENHRREEKLKQYAFQQRERKRLANMTGKQYVPIQGMSQEHILRELLERKQKRQDRAKNLRNKSHLDPIEVSDFDRKTKSKSYMSQGPIFRAKSNRKKNRLDSYSQVYHTQRLNKGQDLFNEDRRPIANSFVAESRARIHFQDVIKKNSSEVYIDEIAIQPLQQEKQQEFDKSRIRNWQEELQINSDTQSDEILRDHFENQKKIKENISKSRVIPEKKQIKQKREAKSYLKTRNTDAEKTPKNRPLTQLVEKKAHTLNIFQKKQSKEQKSPKIQQKPKLIQQIPQKNKIKKVVASIEEEEPKNIYRTYEKIEKLQPPHKRQQIQDDKATQYNGQSEGEEDFTKKKPALKKSVIISTEPKKNLKKEQQREQKQMKARIILDKPKEADKKTQPTKHLDQKKQQKPILKNPEKQSEKPKHKHQNLSPQKKEVKIEKPSRKVLDG